MNTQNIKCTKASAFSLIELMVVIAIVAVLSAVAIPSYKTYNTKARMTEVQSLIGRQLDAWAERQSTGQTQTGLTIPAPTGVTSIASSGTLASAIVVTFVAGTTLAPEFATTPVVITYAAAENATGGTISWSCTITGGANLAARQAVADNYFNASTTLCTRPTA